MDRYDHHQDEQRQNPVHTRSSGSTMQGSHQQDKAQQGQTAEQIAVGDTGQVTLKFVRPIHIVQFSRCVYGVLLMNMFIQLSSHSGMAISKDFLLRSKYIQTIPTVDSVSFVFMSRD